ncbi:hypothetical protein JX265_001844 [Neoarthrinium moseri]|uniref:Rhodopsin domain-containing protein n=1 Tax=Neoarthrinium moseri TaxID=1658444 RepID=A0A9P9WVX5_9PEZI|nr:uncharacterized protein JN550_003569 [Neoarthrinium moseri]KAI1843496.1 hypothetical protein JX266_010322 [Neoarthrinium moseri]KAI1873316.1 hypothetical protein JN550_003569 [Neoarthrinium moseri]KAI1880223.1 hypothetical protein JX265_001844 [Neoarthrinium moseri]
MAIEEQFALMALGLIVIAIRMQVRWKQVGIGNWQLDDYLMPVAGLVFVLETVAAFLVGAMFDGLTNSYMTDEERASLDPSSREFYNRQWGSKIQVIGWSFYAFILWSLKVCIAVFYSRLTQGLAHLRLRVRIAYVLLGVTYATVFLSLLLSCQPMSRFWQINPDPGNLCQPTNSKLYVLIILIPNIITDLYLLSIPLPLLWSVKIGTRRKITLMALFSGAIFVIMAGTIRAVVILTAGPNGAVSGSQWACRETFVAIIVANLPIIQPLIRKAAEKIGLSALFSRTTTNGRSKSHQLEDRNPSDAFSKNRKKPTGHPLSVPHGSGWASDEHILVSDQNRRGSKENGIMVAQEITVQEERASMAVPKGAPNPGIHNDWDYPGATGGAGGKK